MYSSELAWHSPSVEIRTRVMENRDNERDEGGHGVERGGEGRKTLER